MKALLTQFLPGVKWDKESTNSLGGFSIDGCIYGTPLRIEQDNKWVHVTVAGVHRRFQSPVKAMEQLVEQLRRRRDALSRALGDS